MLPRWSPLLLLPCLPLLALAAPEAIVIEEIPPPLPSLSAQTCNACHGEIHDQWAASGHATAFTDPVYQAAVEALGRPAECEPCHLPLEVQRPTLPKGPGKGRVDNPAWDPSLQLEGVTCAACHVREGRIVGPRELAVGQAPHPVTVDASLTTAEACRSCHQSDDGMHETVSEWEASSLGQAGIACQECHMPRTSGRIAGSRYAAYSAHGLTHGRDPAELARALTLHVTVRAASIQRGDALRATATLMNTGAGHAVPTGDPAHRLELAFTIEDHEGALPKGAEPATEWFARELAAPEDGGAALVTTDTRLGPGGQRQVDYAYTADKKSKPGRYTLVVTLAWWAVSAEQAEAFGLTPEDVRVPLAEQRIAFDVN